MGLAKKVGYIALLAGTFAFGKYCTGPDVEKQDVFDYIHNNPKQSKEIFMYTRDYIEKRNPEFLDSLNVKSLSKEQKRELFDDYLESKGQHFYQDLKESLDEFGDKTNRAYDEFKKDK